MILFSSLLTSPLLDDDEQTRQAKVLHAILWMGVVSITLHAIIVLLFIPPLRPFLLLTTPVALAGLLGQVWLRKGYVKTVGLSFMSLFWVFVTVIGWRTGGLMSGALGGYIIVIMLTALTLGRGPSIAMALASIFATLAMVFAGKAGLLQPSPVLHNLGARWVTNTFYYVVSAVVAYWAVQSLQGALEASRRNAEALQASESALQALNADLEDRVAERTAALQRSEARYRAIVEDQSEYIIRFLPDGTVTFANEAYCDYFDVPAGSLEGTTFLPPIYEPDQHRLAQELHLTPDMPRQTVELRTYGADGTLRWQRWHHRALFNEAGASVEYQAVGRDITEEKAAAEEIEQLNEALFERAQHLERANAALASFSYSVSHDLRNPLRAINGYASILLQRNGKTLGPEGTRLLRNITEASEHMDRLIQDLLAYARLGQDEAIHLQPVPLGDVFEHLLKVLYPQIQQTQAQIHLPDHLPTVLGDPTLLHQLFLNLLDNALTYTPAGIPPEIHLTTTLPDDAPDQVCIHLRDHGIGIPAQYREKVFEVFERLHDPSAYPGTGIGLALVAKASALMQGTVEADAAPEGGSVFTVCLKRLREEQPT